jgi:dihydroflavonol-4-reductase
MKKILVTGATGCVGSNLINELISRGYTVRAFHRSPSQTTTLAGIDIEHCTGDIRDKAVLLRAIEGCDTVFHTAAIVSFWKKKREEQLSVNVTGTRTVVEACLESGIQKLIHTSSVAALGYSIDGKLIDETTAYNWGQDVTYKYSKHLSELEILTGVQKGLNATMVNPSVIIGPGDVYVHGGQIVRDITLGKIPVYVQGGMNLVSVHDVVRGHIAAAELGKSGERYILGGINLTHKAVFDLAARVLHGKSPSVKVPVPVAKGIGKLFDTVGRITGREPWVTSDLLSGIGKCQWYSIEKAKRDLNYTVSSIETAMREAHDWYRKNNML